MADYRKPLPRPTEDTKEFWEGCRRHELTIQICRDCGKYRFYPCAMCHFCGSVNADWVKVSGKGKVYTWTVIRKAADPAWKDEVPYIVVVVELDEQPGLFMPGNLLDCEPKDIRAAMPVEVTFVDIANGVTLPQWRPASIKI